MITALKGLRIFAALILSILLILIATAYPLYYTISSFTIPRNVTQLVQDVIPTILPDAESMSEALSIEGLGDDATTALLQSEVVSDIMELYTSDTLDALLKGDSQNKFTAEALKNIVGDNMTEVVGIIREHLPEDSTITEADITAKVNEVMDTNAEELVQTMTNILPVSSLASSNEKSLTVIRSLLSPWITAGFLLTILFCTSMIVLCRLKQWRWMKWLAIVSLIVAAFTGLTALLSSVILSAVGSSLPDEIIGVVSLILESFQQNLIPATVIEFMLGAALIVSYTVLRRKKAR